MSTMPQMPGDELIGQMLGGYEILERLGQGGMATVFLARQVSIDRDVAIKILPPTFMHDPTFLQRFEREVKVIARLQHPRILPVHDYGQIEGRPFIVMAYMEGGTLDDRLDNAMSLEDTVRLVNQIAEGLDHAHGEGVIHRDFKPSNVLLDRAGNAFLADFGIAKINEATTALTGSSIIGTPAYMAPEMFDQGAITPAVDIYALGITIYQMLTGHFPFEGDTPMRVMMQHVSALPPDVRIIRPDLPEEVGTVIQTAMAKRPEHRYPTAGMLAQALDAAARGQEVRPIATGDYYTMPGGPPTEMGMMQEARSTAAGVPGAGGDLETAAPRARPRKSGRLGLWIVLVLVAIAAVAGGGGFYVYTNQQNAGATATAQVIAALQTVTADAHMAETRSAQSTATAAAESGFATGTATALVGFEAEATATAVVQATVDAIATATTRALSESQRAATASALQTQTAIAQATQTAEAQATASARTALLTDAALAVDTFYSQETINTLLETARGLPPDYNRVDELAHELDGAPEIVFSTNEVFQNFVLEATFTNPFSLAFGVWDIGILFRSQGPFDQFRLYMDASGSWYFENWKGGSGYYEFINGGSAFFDTNTNATNTLTFIAIEDRGFVVINGQFIERVYLLGGNELGEVGVGIGFSDGKERETNKTPYDLRVWALPDLE